MYDSNKYKRLYISSERFRSGRIRHAKKYQLQNKEKYKLYQKSYRMKKRIEKALFGFVCEARMGRAVDAIMDVFDREMQLDKDKREKQV